MNPEEVLNELQKRIDQDAMLGAIRDRIADGKATDLDSARYCIRSGTVAGKYLGSQILDVPSDAREALCVDVLHVRYKDAVKQCAAVQKAQDAKQGLHLAPQIPAFNSERAHKIGRSTADPTAEDETIRRRADAPIANAAASVHDDFVRKQADFRSGAGLSCQITRDCGSGCCPWCAEIAGRYAYGNAPKDIYARHDNCACTVTFESGRKRGGRSGRQIEHPAQDAGAAVPVRFTAENAPQGAPELGRITAEQARELTEERRPKRFRFGMTERSQNGLTGEREPAIMKNIELPPETSEIRSMSDETLQLISDAFDSIMEEYDVRVDEIITMPLSPKERTVPFQFQPIRGKNGELIKRIVINSSYDFMGSQAKMQERIMKNFNSGTLASNCIKGLIAHELAHVMTFQDVATFSGYLIENKSVAERFVPGISRYATASSDGAECIAEAFAAKICGLQISQEAQALLNEFIEWRRKHG